ncbi:MAG: caspase family protein, partial [Polyangiaceae bacterium]
LGRDYLLFSGDAQGAIVAEVSRYARGRTLSVKPGVYFVRGRSSDYLLEGSLAVAPRERQAVTDDRLARVQYARLARKGSGESLVAHGPLAGYTLRTALPNSSEPCHGAFLSYPFALPLLTLSPRLSACHSGFDNRYLRANANEYALELELAHAWDLPLVSLNAGVAAGSALLEQTFESAGRARPRRNLAITLAATLGAQLDLAGGFYLSLEAGLQSYAFRLTRDGDRSAAWEAALALRGRGGVGWYW